ncbi:conserved exported hypothetical protein [Mesorhizobium sp. ORS 3324]|nr:conserved exported hypothetical protein [Mesorhizobium sp. ORS 3324]
MRQRLLNGWLVAALVALVCLLGLTAYVEVRQELPQAACVRNNAGVNAPVARCESCEPAQCDGIAPRA